MTEEQRLFRKQRLIVNGMSLLGILLLIVFVVSCHQSVPNGTKEPMTEPTVSTTQSEVEPSRFSECKAIFGENSLGSALIGVDFAELTRNDKTTIQYIVLKHGGSVVFNEKTIVLTQGKSTMKFYTDKTYTMLDSNGNSTGTRWIRTQYSKDLPMLEHELLLCMTTSESFVARYRVEDAAVFTSYCDTLQNLGYTQEMFTSSIMFTGTTKEGVTASVSFSDNLLTILIESEEK